MNWLLLVLGGFCETGFAVCLGYAHSSCGTKAVFWYIAFFVSLTMSMLLLNEASKTIPLGTAYSVWTGIGAVGTVILGILLFHEPAQFGRLFFLSTLIISIIGLKLVS